MHDTNPTLMIDLIPLNTNAFLVSNEHKKDERYNAVIADKYFRCEILWNDFMKYG